MDESEFDLIADEYDAQLNASIEFSGESSEFFARYKIQTVARHCRAKAINPHAILDFGAGTGASLPHFREAFPDAQMICADVSRRSLKIAEKRFASQARFLHIANSKLPLGDNSVDLVFSACVFHHIPAREHHHWLKEMLRVARPDALLIIFEHNPLNPLTTKVVRDCPFDKNAVLIRASEFNANVEATGWNCVKNTYTLFMPRQLSFLRRLESAMGRLPLGAQYYVSGRKSSSTVPP